MRSLIRLEPSGPVLVAAPPDVSVLVLAAERAGSLVELYHEYAPLLREAGYTFEFLFLAHPEYAPLTVPLRSLAEAGEPVRAMVSERSVGETALLRVGILNSSGRTIVTLPAYRQTVASGVLELLSQVAAGADLAVARRWPRRDPFVNRLQSRVFHRIVSGLSAHRVHDVGCSVRAARREVLEEIPLYGDFARFLPILALDRGFRVTETPVTQHEFDRNSRVYGPGIYLRRAIDVLGLFFLLRFTDKPLRFFGLVGSVLAGSGAVLLLVLLVQRLQHSPIGQRPLLLLAVLLVTLGAQSIALGLIGEIVVHIGASGQRRYRVRTVTRGGRPSG
ncbi:MAG TPA: hypothetical protein VHQ45_15510 [Gemmatimonadaceae bacterium]|jgi:hypothetical protein|nr:hypothetical protein [Gemmatimonadaceae bacterium]